MKGISYETQKFYHHHPTNQYLETYYAQYEPHPLREESSQCFVGLSPEQSHRAMQSHLLPWPTNLVLAGPTSTKLSKDYSPTSGCNGSTESLFLIWQNKFAPTTTTTRLPLKRGCGRLWQWFWRIIWLIAATVSSVLPICQRRFTMAKRGRPKKVVIPFEDKPPELPIEYQAPTQQDIYNYLIIRDVEGVFLRTQTAYGDISNRYSHLLIMVTTGKAPAKYSMRCWQGIAH